MEVMTAKKWSGRRVRVILAVVAALFLGGVWYTLHVLETGDDRFINWVASKSPARVKAGALVRQAMSSDPVTRGTGESGIAALRRSADVDGLVESIADNPQLAATIANTNGEGCRLCALVGAIGGPAVQPLLDQYRGGLRQDYRSFIGEWFVLYAQRRNSRRAVVAQVAREALARMGEPLVGPLVAMATGKSQDDKWFAMDLLSDVKSPAATTALIKIFKMTTDGIQSRAMRALSDHANPVAAETFAAIAPTWQSYYDSGYLAIIGLGRLKDPRAIEGLCRMLKDPRLMVESMGTGYPATRAGVASLLGGYTDPQVEEALISALDDRDSDVRGAVAKSLGNMGGPSALAPLRQAISDEDTGVRAAARDAIARIKARAANKSSAP